MKKVYRFIVYFKTDRPPATPKGIYYPDIKNIVLVGCTKKSHTVREKIKLSDVEYVDIIEIKI